MASDVANEAQGFLAKLERWIGPAEDEEPITIYLFKSYDEFQRTMRAKGEGITYYGSCQPLVGLPHRPLEIEQQGNEVFIDGILTAVGADWRRRLRHELVHVYFRNAHGLERDWLWEGLADYLAHDGAAGDGMKAQRFLTLKSADLDGRLHHLQELRTTAINAGRDDAELLYAEAWSVVYTMMNLCGPELRGRFREWLAHGAPGNIEQVFEGTGFDADMLDERRSDFVSGFRCFLEIASLSEDHHGWKAGLRNGDRLLRLQYHSVGFIDNKKELGLYLSYLFQPPPSITERGQIFCILERDQNLLLVELPIQILVGLNWRLMARAPTPRQLKLTRHFHSFPRTG